MKRYTPPMRRPRLVQLLRNMYALDLAGDKPAAQGAFQRLPRECRGVLCLLMFYGRCKSRQTRIRWVERQAREVVSFDGPTVTYTPEHPEGVET